MKESLWQTRYWSSTPTRIAIIAVNRPHARNAINHAVSVAMAAALDELDERDDLTVGIVTGAGGTFSSGMDLKAFLAGENVSLEGKGLAGVTKAPPRAPAPVSR